MPVKVVDLPLLLCRLTVSDSVLSNCIIYNNHEESSVKTGNTLVFREMWFAYIYIYIKYFWRKYLCYSVVSFFIHVLSAALATVALREPVLSPYFCQQVLQLLIKSSLFAGAVLAGHSGGFLLKWWLFPTCTCPCCSADLGPQWAMFACYARCAIR